MEDPAAVGGDDCPAEDSEEDRGMEGEDGPVC